MPPPGVHETRVIAAGSAPELRPEVREPVDRVVVEARLVGQEELPDLLEVFDREDALPLPLRPHEQVPVHQLLEVIRQRRLRHADGRLQLPKVRPSYVRSSTRIFRRTSFPSTARIRR